VGKLLGLTIGMDVGDLLGLIVGFDIAGIALGLSLLVDVVGDLLWLADVLAVGTSVGNVSLVLLLLWESESHLVSQWEWISRALAIKEMFLDLML
jgi:hypothetical protein